MTKTLLSGVAAMAFAFAAPAAFAQDSNIDPDIDAKMKTEQMIDKAEEAADDLEETTDELAETSEDMWDTEKDDRVDADDSIDTKTETVIDGEGYVTPSVECPEGKTVQPDGTCLAIGEWKPEN